MKQHVVLGLALASFTFVAIAKDVDIEVTGAAHR
jgi:hypothetical protein